MTDPVDSTVNVNQTDYMKVFMQELAYQDPLKPIDNREFMAQMAQFSALQQAAETSAHVTELLEVAYDNRGINLVGKEVRMSDSNEYGIVQSVYLNDKKLTELRVKPNNGPSVKIGMDKIIEIHNIEDKKE